MTKLSLSLGALALAYASAGTALAETYQLIDETAAFRPGQGVDIAQNNCQACHSADYIAFQPSKMGQVFWETEVQKMINVFHAPIAEADAKTIADYLAKTY